MTNKIEAYKLYKEYIWKATKLLQSKKYGDALKYIELAILENYHAPEAHNLLGIYEEMTGDASLARKHFRAAYALDPTYKPASRNLERITGFMNWFKKSTPDYGENYEPNHVVMEIEEE